MSTETAATAEAGGLNQQVEAVIRESNALMAAQAAGRNVRMLLLLALVVFVAAVTFAFYDMANKFFSRDNLNVLAKAGQERLVKNQDKYMKEIQKLVEASSPVLTSAFMEQAKKDMPGFMQAAEKERDALRSSLEIKLAKKLDDRYREGIDRHEQILRQEFPEYNNDAQQARMRENIGLALDKLVQKYYVQEMNRQMNSLYNTWDSFPAADPPAKNGISTEDQMVVELVDLLKYRLSHTQATP
jgi:hypothetical protein